MIHNNSVSLNKIIVTIILIFVLLIAYKYIGTSIQENKEKAVLQEKAQLQVLEKEPLNKCIDDIDSATKLEIKTWQDMNDAQRMPDAQASCLKIKPINGGVLYNLIASGKITLKDYCWPSIEEEAAEIQKINNKALIDKEECYKRYK